MEQEATVAGSPGAVVRCFSYPEAPWGHIPDASLFREIGLQESVSVDALGEELPSGLSLPARYEYRVEPGFELESDSRLDTAEDGAPAGTPADTVAEREGERHFRELLAAECSKAEERGRSLGVEWGLSEGRRQGREEAIRQLKAGVEDERQRFAERTAALLRSFDEARDGYIHRLEQETAGLALAIAARILRREAQADPLLLTGAVRVALGQLAANTAVRLRVPSVDLPLWTEALAHLPNLSSRPELIGLIGDPSLELGECRLETELGSADLGLSAQLEALERGFFERDLPATEDDFAAKAISAVPVAQTTPTEGGGNDR